MIDSRESAAARPRGHRATMLAGLAIVAVAGGLRWLPLRESLWLDELHTAWCVSGGWSDVAERAAIGNQSPWYFYLLRAIVAVAGPSELALRLPSLAAGTCLVAWAGIVTRRWARSTAAGLFAAALVAVDRNGIFFSTEARPYAIVQLLAWCHAVVVWRLATTRAASDRVLFIGGAIGLFYLHYTSALFILGEGVFLLDRCLRRPNREPYPLRQLGLDLSLIAIASLPASAHLLEIAGRREMWERFVKSPTLADFWRVLRLDVYWLPIAAAFLICAVWTGRRAWAATRRPDDSAWQLIISVLVVPSLVAWMATRHQLAALFLGRYLVSSLLAAPLAAAVVLPCLSSRLARMAVMGGTLAVSVWASGMWWQWSHDGRVLGDRRQDWRAAVSYINERATGSSAVCFVRSGLVEEAGLTENASPQLVAYCLAPVHSLYPLKTRAIALPSARADSLSSKWFESGIAGVRWFLINGSEATRQRFLRDVERQCHDRGRGERCSQVAAFGDLIVFQLSADQPTSPRSMTSP